MKRTTEIRMTLANALKMNASQIRLKGEAKSGHVQDAYFGTAGFLADLADWIHPSIDGRTPEEILVTLVIVGVYISLKLVGVL